MSTFHFSHFGLASSRGLTECDRVNFAHITHWNESHHLWLLSPQLNWVSVKNQCFRWPTDDVEVWIVLPQEVGFFSYQTLTACFLLIIDDSGDKGLTVGCSFYVRKCNSSLVLCVYSTCTKYANLIGLLNTGCMPKFKLIKAGQVLPVVNNWKKVKTFISNMPLNSLWKININK